jgi:hypothetical protein
MKYRFQDRRHVSALIFGLIIPLCLGTSELHGERKKTGRELKYNEKEKIEVTEYEVRKGRAKNRTWWSRKERGIGNKSIKNAKTDKSEI